MRSHGFDSWGLGRQDLIGLIFCLLSSALFADDKPASVYDPLVKTHSEKVEVIDLSVQDAARAGRSPARLSLRKSEVGSGRPVQSRAGWFTRNGTLSRRALGSSRVCGGLSPAPGKRYLRVEGEAATRDHGGHERGSECRELYAAGERHPSCTRPVGSLESRDGPCVLRVIRPATCGDVGALIWSCHDSSGQRPRTQHGGPRC